MGDRDEADETMTKERYTQLKQWVASEHSAPFIDTKSCLFAVKDLLGEVDRLRAIALRIATKCEYTPEVDCPEYDAHQLARELLERRT